MSKETLALANFRDGIILNEANEAIAQATKALKGAGKGKTAKILIELSIKNADGDDNFAEVSGKVTLKAPAPTSLTELLPIQGGRLVVDDAPKPQAPILGAIADIDQKRNAG